MSRGTFTWDSEQGCLVPYVRERRSVSAPSVITDEIPGGIKSMADCQHYTSKSKLRASYRRLGKVELGNDWNYTPSHQEDPRAQEKLEADVARAYYQCRDGMAPLSELDKERCRIMDRNRQHYNYDNRDYDRDGKLRD